MLLSAKCALPEEAGYALFWSGKNKEEHHLSGVMIKTSIARKLQNLSLGHSDHLMSLRLPIQDKFATVICMYTPPLQAETGVKEACYHNLRNFLQQVDSIDKILTLGDFNARVG